MTLADSIRQISDGRESCSEGARPTEQLIPMHREWDVARIQPLTTDIVPY